MAALPCGHIGPIGSVIRSAMPEDLVQSVELKLPIHGATEADESAPRTRNADSRARGRKRADIRTQSAATRGESN
jgi:predicted neutral ceramidase superfamily lipid hydrolase